MLWFQYTKMNRPYRLRHRAALEDIDPRQIPYIFTLTVYFSMSSLAQVGRASSMSGAIYISIALILYNTQNKSCSRKRFAT